MASQDIASALQRVGAVLRRRPESGLHEDAPGIARWQGGLRMMVSHAGGTQVLTDMPAELGGTGDQVSPGWLMRAGIASCAATCVVMAAAAEGIELAMLEVEACSRSDARGLLGMTDADGSEIDAGPLDIRLLVRVSAPGVPAERLRKLVERSHRQAPVSSAIRTAVRMDLQIEVGVG